MQTKFLFSRHATPLRGESRGDAYLATPLCGESRGDAYCAILFCGEARGDWGIS